jgi:cytochrome c oxidase subunit II
MTWPAQFARTPLATALLLLLSACSGQQPQQTMMRPAGPMASNIEHLWWFIFVIAVVVFVIVFALFTGAIATRRVRGQAQPITDFPIEVEQRRVRIVIAATVLSVLVLFSILGYSVVTSKNMNSLASKNPVSIKVTGHQWWWEVEYPNPQADLTVTTANEIHVPIGVPVVLQTASADVIHSFWAPNIQGKRDLIPGYENAIWFQIDKEGTYRGQCAEFCGHEHAKMSFYVVAESQDKFNAWLQQQRKPAPDPPNDVLAHGRDVFVKGTCVMCHTVRGTDAGSRFGPDLTHVGSRMTLAALTIDNTPAGLLRWITDPQHVKAGAKMPALDLSRPDFVAIADYLRSLK